MKEEHLLAFREQLLLREFGSREEAFVANEFHDKIGFITEGLVRAYYINDKGDDRTVWFIKKNEFVTDYPAFLNGIKSKYTFETVVPTVIVFLPREAIYNSYQLSSANQKYGRLIAEQIVERLQDRMESFLFLSAKERYVNFVQHNKGLMNIISVKDMASLIGIERQSLTRLRAELLKED